jgi:2'-5' RNA ligase
VPPSFPLRSAFLALPLEDTAKKVFVDIQKRLQEYDGVFTFQNPDSPHLTLQFWKELMEIEYNQVLEQSRKIASITESFILKIEGFDTFGSHGNPRVVFLAVPFNEPLARLKKRCPWPSRIEAEEKDAPLDAFHPHITLARIRHPQRYRVIEKKVAKTLKDVSFAMTVDRLRLYGKVGENHQTPLNDFSLAQES